MRRDKNPLLSHALHPTPAIQRIDQIPYLCPLPRAGREARISGGASAGWAAGTAGDDMRESGELEGLAISLGREACECEP
jgi:hypothetical protein